MKKLRAVVFVVILSIITIFALSNKERVEPVPHEVEFSSSREDSIPDLTRMFPVILVKKKDQAKSSPLPLDKLKIDVKVVGNIATTTFEMTFYNKLNRVLEGELFFPLGEGKTVSRFAMEIDGKLREGVIVEKAKGRKVFESIVRKNVDPGLLEWTKGNNFRARVYPIPAKGYKKIVLSYEQSLLSYPSEDIYILPLGIEQEIGTFDLKVEVFKQIIKPDLDGNELSNFSFDKWNESYIAESHRSNYIPNEQLIFGLPLTKSHKQIHTQSVNGENYFYLSVTPKFFEKREASVKSIGLLWDISNSASKRDLKKEMKVLDSYFNQFSSLNVELTTFSSEVHEKKAFKISDGNWEALRTYLDKLEYDGGTQLGSLNISKLKGEKFLLFSDGLSNFGNNEVHISDKPIYSITTNFVSDFSYLKFLAASSGGQFINGSELTVREIAGKLNNSPYRFIGASFNDEACEIYPKTELLSKKRFQLAGKFSKSDVSIKLNFGFGDKILHTETVRIKVDNENQSKMIRSIWAQKKLSYLDVMHKQNEEQIVTLGKEYGLVTRYTSLIVLDRFEDYLEHKIVPPTEWKEKYFEKIAQQKNAKEDNDKNHLTTVKELFNGRIEWWNKNFEEDLKKYKTELENDNRSRNGVDVSDSIMLDGLTITRENISRMPARTLNYSSSPTIGGVDSEMEVLEEVVVASYSAFSDRIDGNFERKSNTYSRGKQAKIKLKEWSPDAPYLDKLKKTAKKQLWSTYLDLKKEYAKTPAFYLDVSIYFTKELNKETALRVLSNLAELELENHQILRILAYRLIELKQYELAIATLKDVVKLREEEPQSYRDLGLALALNNQPQEAIESLYIVVEKKWDDRFPEVELIVLNEINAIIEKNAGLLDIDFMDKSLVKNLPVDIRIVLNWDTDNCDMDLWVTGPLGEKCFYSHNKTRAGGIMTRDFTRGYGPEVFLIKNAVKGKYKIEANYYGTSSQKLLGPVTIKLNFFTKYGTNNQDVKEVTLRLTKGKEVVEIAEIEF